MGIGDEDVDIDIEGLELEDFQILEFSTPQYDMVPKFIFEVQEEDEPPTRRSKKHKLPMDEPCASKEINREDVEVPETLRKLKILKEAKEDGLITEQQFVDKQNQFLQSLKFNS